MGEGTVNAKNPKYREEQVGFELHALGYRSTDESRSNDGEHHLEEHECLMWNRRGVVGIRFQTDSFQEKYCIGFPKKAFPSPKAKL